MPAVSEGAEWPGRLPGMCQGRLEKWLRKVSSGVAFPTPVFLPSLPLSLSFT